MRTSINTAAGIEFTRVDNDINGNPRYVCHYFSLLKASDEATIKADFAASIARNPFSYFTFQYDAAIQRAKKLGGKKFHNKQFGGGIVFQSYNIEDTAYRILELLAA